MFLSSKIVIPVLSNRGSSVSGLKQDIRFIIIMIRTLIKIFTLFYLANLLLNFLLLLNMKLTVLLMSLFKFPLSLKTISSTLYYLTVIAFYTVVWCSILVIWNEILLIWNSSKHSAQSPSPVGGGNVQYCDVSYLKTKTKEVEEKRKEAGIR